MKDSRSRPRGRAAPHPRVPEPPRVGAGAPLRREVLRGAVQEEAPARRRGPEVLRGQQGEARAARASAPRARAPARAGDGRRDARREAAHGREAARGGAAPGDRRVRLRSSRHGPLDAASRSRRAASAAASSRPSRASTRERRTVSRRAPRCEVVGAAPHTYPSCRFSFFRRSCLRPKRAPPGADNGDSSVGTTVTE